MKNKSFLLLYIILSGMFFSCSEENPVEIEQYIKQLYIVGAVDIIKSYDVPYGDGPQSTFITVASGGSLNLDKDVQITLATNDNTIDWYNNKYMIDTYMKYSKLKEEFYDIPSMTVTIKAGEVYSRLPFTINSSDIHCDSLYTLTFKIESVSDYQKVTKDTVLMMNLNMVNEYSGDYIMSITKYTIDPISGSEGNATPLTVSRQLKAVDKNSVRFFNETISESTGSYSTKEEYFNAIDDNCVILEFDEIGGVFKARGWKNMQITGSEITYTYDSVLERGQFEILYDYEKDGTTYRIRGTLAQ